MAIQIRKGEVRRCSHDDWSLIAVVEMIRKFVHHLPDMDLLFNVHDEPSVIILNDMLNHLVSTARAIQHDSSHNVFSTRPTDLVDEIPGHYGTNLLRIGRQTLWQQLIASCPIDSPVRTSGSDFTESYAREPLDFIYNATAFSDVCNQLHITTASLTVQIQCSTSRHSFRYFRRVKSTISVILSSLIRGITTNERGSTQPRHGLGFQEESDALARKHHKWVCFKRRMETTSSAKACESS